MNKFLPRINSPEDLKKLSLNDLPILAVEIRDLILDVVSNNGGHLGANLGVVELTIALHYVFDSPRDIIIYDVSHQSYPHKILTGRRDQFHTLRTANGISGFTRRCESKHDHFGAGHASTALSAALGFATARDLQGLNHHVVPVVGDGSLTGGIAWEGLNQLGASGRNVLVILNDNAMSISKNVGALSKYLTEIISDQSYNRLKNDIWKLTGILPKHNEIRKAVAAVDEAIKGVMVPGVIFEKLGFRYFGPVDGHDSKMLIRTLNLIKSLPGPKLLHAITVKGKGYKHAEEQVIKFHGVSKFDKVTGQSLVMSKALPYSTVFGQTLMHLAEDNKKICAITAAMSSGTGLDKFAEKYPDRFFDVGIAEQHGTTFSAGLAAAGQKPFFAVYSTFLQRGYDQVIHDVALQNLPVVFCLDRAGIVGDDGPTHHGVFDVSYLRAVPNMTMIAPKDGRELRDSLAFASTYYDGPIAIRYPRGSIPEETVDMNIQPLQLGSWEILREGSDIAILAVGAMVYESLKAAEILLKDGIRCRVVNCRFIKPMDLVILRDTLENFKAILAVSENAQNGGFGEGVLDWAAANDFVQNAISVLEIPDKFYEHASRQQILREVGLDSEGISMAAFQQHQKIKEISRSRKKN